MADAPIITAAFAALLAALYLRLAMAVIKVRRSARVVYGDGSNKTLLKRMRGHANFAEYVPFALVLMALAESLGGHWLTMILLGSCLLVGRGMHAWYCFGNGRSLKFRVRGMVLTFAAIAGSAFLIAILLAGRVLGLVTH